MFRNYLTIAYRNLTKHKVFSFINSLGLALGMAACLLVLQYVLHEFSYDDFHAKGDRIYRISTSRYVAGELDGQVAQVYNAVGPVVQKDFPEVEGYARLRAWFGSPVVSHTPGLDLNKFKLIT